MKNILEVKIKPKNDIMYQDTYNCICQNTEKENNYTAVEVAIVSAVPL